MDVDIKCKEAVCERRATCERYVTDEGLFPEYTLKYGMFDVNDCAGYSQREGISGRRLALIDCKNRGVI